MRIQQRASTEPMAPHVCSQITIRKTRDCPPEVRQLGRTMRKRRTQIAPWHQAQVSNGPTETNGLCKRIERVAFGMTNFGNWRIRLLYAGRPDWSKLATISP